MGRHNRHKKSVCTGLRVMTPIEELSGESRSPTPVNGTARNKEHKDQKKLQSGDTTPKQESRPNSENEKDDCNSGESFTDHLQGLVEDYTEELITKRRQLRQEREVSAGLWIEYLNFRTSWLMNQTEIEELNNRLVEMENKQRETQNEMKKIKKKLEEEHAKLKLKYKELGEDYGRLKASFNDVVEENKSMKKMGNRSAELDMEKMGNRSAELDMEKMGNRSAELETERSGKTPLTQEMKMTNGPTVPLSPVKGQRRPYTGRSRDEQTTQLPPITDNNKVVNSSSAASSPIAEKQCLSPVHLSPIPCPAKPMVPTPPKLPRPSNSISGRRHSHIPLALPPIRGASSAGNVRDQEHGQKLERAVRSKK